MKKYFSAAGCNIGFFSGLWERALPGRGGGEGK
jgi:hypothetical protein